MRITFVNRSGQSVDGPRYRRFLRCLAGYLDAPSGSLTVLFCGDEEIAALNGAWRGKPRPTDVLSFEGGGATAEGRAHLGDLAISLDTASRAAKRAGLTATREVETLLAHGLLHLMGYDHETDDGTMMRLQRRALAAVRRTSPSPGSRARTARRATAKPPGRRR